MKKLLQLLEEDCTLTHEQLASIDVYKRQLPVGQGDLGGLVVGHA